MSDVLIKRMEKPKNCDECYFESHGIYSAVKKVSGKVVDAEDWYLTRPTYCQLIEVKDSE